MMIDYISLPMPAKTMLVTALFLTLCAGVSALLMIGRKQGIAKLAALALMTAANGAMMLMYAALIPAERAKPDIPALCIRFSQLPVLISLLIWLASVFFLALLLRSEYARRKTDVTASSIKESLDHLHTGLCFAQKNGLVLLSNHRINELSHAIFEKPLQNADLFWKSLCGGETAGKAKRIHSGENPQFRLDDGSIWSFRQEHLDGIRQITAADVTKEHRLIEQLHSQNRELEAMNERIRSYGEKVDEYVAARERLETRINLHGFLGQSLLTTRHHLTHHTGDMKAILEMWQRNIDVLRLEAEPQPPADSFLSLRNAASAIGMQVHVRGHFPESPHLTRLLAAIGAQTLTNAVRHAGASQLFIDAEEGPHGYTIRYTNDGAPPAAPVAEGGGLSSARKKIESAGGSMRIETQPRFALIVTFTKEVTTHV